MKTCVAESPIVTLLHGAGGTAVDCIESSCDTGTVRVADEILTCGSGPATFRKTVASCVAVPVSQFVTVKVNTKVPTVPRSRELQDT